jgi:hypothetical protein
MSDYYTLLLQKIRDAKNDPDERRKLVYGAARLALKRHVDMHDPPISREEGKRLLGDLEAAIERLQTDGIDDETIPPFSTDRPSRVPVLEIDFIAASDDTPSDRDHSIGDAVGTSRGEAESKGEGRSVAARGSAARSAALRRSANDRPTGRVVDDREDDFEDGVEDEDDRKDDYEDDYDSGSAPTPDQRAIRAGGQRRAAFASRPAYREALPGRAGEQVSSRQDFGDERGDLSEWADDGPNTGSALQRRALGAGHGALVTRDPTYLVRPRALPARYDDYFREPPPPSIPLGHTILIAVQIVLQFIVVILAGAAFYVALWGREGAPLRDMSAMTPQPAAKVAPQIAAAARRRA